MKPRTYLDVAGGELVRRARVDRGRLFRLPAASEAELERWYLEEEPREVDVYRPDAFLAQCAKQLKVSRVR